MVNELFFFEVGVDEVGVVGGGGGGGGGGGSILDGGYVGFRLGGEGGGNEVEEWVFGGVGGL